MHDTRIQDTTKLDLSLFPENLKQMAVTSLLERDVLGFLCRATNELSIDIVSLNAEPLRDLGLLEVAIAEALIATRLNNRRHYRQVQTLIRSADRTRLLNAGDPLPGTGPWTVYRGVGGKTIARRIRGYSWTTDLAVAEYFAKRASVAGLADPAIYAAVVPQDYVLFYSHQRMEAEFFVSLPPRFPVTRLG
jgi:hypothetical protein